MTHDNEDRPPVDRASLGAQMQKLLAHENTFPVPKPTVEDHNALAEAPQLGPEWTNQ